MYGTIKSNFYVDVPENDRDSIDNAKPSQRYRRTNNGSWLLFKIVPTATISLIIIFYFTTEINTSDSETTQCPVLKWSDEFDDASLPQWEFELGNGCDIGLCGWGNNELQNYTRHNVDVSAGLLTIHVTNESSSSSSTTTPSYQSARLRTYDHANVTYGRMESRVKLPFGRGIWPAFWMMPTESVYGGWPNSGEIDICEGLGHEVSTIHGTIHYADDEGNHAWSTQHTDLLEGVVFHDDFREFAVEWDEDEISWLLDGARYFRVQKKELELTGHWPFDQQFYFILNVAVGGNWPGNPDDTTVFPQRMDVDFVRAYNTSKVSFGYLDGKRIVEFQQVGVMYTLYRGISDYTYRWSVPSKATIVKSFNDSIIVNFGDTSGNVQVIAQSDSCDVTREFSIPVKVNPTYTLDFTFINTDDIVFKRVTLSSASGSYDVVSNPDVADSLNPSVNVIQYKRNADAVYDTISFDTLSISHPNEYVKGTKRFYLDVYSNIQHATTIWIQLENCHVSNEKNYPTGRHSRYEATIPYDTKPHWKQLAFNLLDRPDEDEMDVNCLVLLFNPGEAVNYTYFFDKLDSYSV